MFTYDGKSYDVLVTKCTRSFSKLSTDKSGRVQNGDMFIDLIGVFYNYSIIVQARDGNMAELDRFWEDISAPKAFVTTVFPYNQSSLTFEAYVTQGTQDLIRTKLVRLIRKNYWGPIALNFISRSPQRRAL